MNDNPESSNRVPVAGLAVDACSARGESPIEPWQQTLARMASQITRLRQERDDALDVCSSRERDLRRNQSRLDDANGRLHMLQSMMDAAGFPMRVKLGEDLHGNEDFARVRVECQMRDLITELRSLRASLPNQ